LPVEEVTQRKSQGIDPTQSAIFFHELSKADQDNKVTRKRGIGVRWAFSEKGKMRLRELKVRFGKRERQEKIRRGRA
jgi:hypothetical protein